MQFLPPCLEDYVPPESAARFIEAYVEHSVDFVALGFTHAQPAATGRPAYHPADMLKLYLYGYLNRIRSSRRLEAEARRNLELIWLLRGVGPDFKTIADFRKDNRQVFKPLFKEFNLLCRKLDLFGAELVAIDGSRFKALNNSRRHYTQQQVQDLLGKVEASIERYLSELDAQDVQAQGVAAAPNRKELEQKIGLLKDRKGQYEELLEEFKSTGQSEISLSDADSRKMKDSRGGHLIAYNVQAAVDAKHDLIVAQEVVNCSSDRGQLSGMAIAAKQQLQGEALKAVADKGYHEADQLEACEKAGIETLVPEQGKTGGRTREGKSVFPKEQFRYEPQLDAYRCPADQLLNERHTNTSHGKKRILYSNRAACRSCSLRTQCTTANYRVIGRRTNEAVAERAAQRVAAQPQIVARRKSIVEHVFGTLRQWDHDSFLLRGLEKVRAEFSLSALTYNLRRLMSLKTLQEVLKAVAGPTAEVPV
jgi:transposase